MAELPKDLSSTGLGDLDKILNNQSVSDLSWLNVDPEEYRRLEALPKQNLDTIPELNKALEWDPKDDRGPSLIPLRPHAIVNTNPLERPDAPSRASTASVRDRVASYVMIGMPSKVISERLSAEFSPGQIQAEAPGIKEVLEERGLLGNVYINSSHFKKCAQDGPHRKFVAKHSPKSLYVLSKPECTNCIRNSGGHCASFQKRIVDDVPYDGMTLAHYSVQLAAEKRTPPQAGTAKEKLRTAFRLSPIGVRTESVQVAQYQRPEAKPQVTQADMRSFLERRANKPAVERPDPAYLVAVAKLTKNKVAASLLSSSSNPEVRKAALAFGLVGHTYLDVDALGGPAHAESIIASSPHPFAFVVLRDPSDYPTEEIVSLSKVANVVDDVPEITKEHFVLALERAVSEKRVSPFQLEAAVKNSGDSANWARLTAQANLIRPPEVAPEPADLGVLPAQSGSFYYGHSAPEFQKTVDPEEVRMSISSMMNTGLSGPRLKDAILSRYSSSDLQQVPDVGRALSPDDGVQGFYFLDPTAYSDYGHGCIRGSSSLKKSKAAFVLASSSCTGCTHQTAPSWCNRYSRRLARAVPEEVRSRVAAARHLPVVQHAPPENPVEKYELRSELHVDIAGARSRPVEIKIPGGSLSD